MELDDIGLPAHCRIEHNEFSCACTQQDDLFVQFLEDWRASRAELLQIDPECAVIVVIELMTRWGLDTTGLFEGYSESIEEWRENMAKQAMPYSPIAKGRIVKRRCNGRGSKARSALLAYRINGT